MGVITAEVCFGMAAVSMSFSFFFVSVNLLFLLIKKR